MLAANYNLRKCSQCSGSGSIRIKTGIQTHLRQLSKQNVFAATICVVGQSTDEQQDFRSNSRASVVEQLHPYTWADCEIAKSLTHLVRLAREQCKARLKLNEIIGKLIFGYVSLSDSNRSRFGAVETIENSLLISSWQSRRWKCWIQTRCHGNVSRFGETRKYMHKLIDNKCATFNVWMFG